MSEKPREVRPKILMMDEKPGELWRYVVPREFWDVRDRLSQKPSLTMREQGQLAALNPSPCTPPDGLTEAEEDEWCEGWGDYGEDY